MAIVEYVHTVTVSHEALARWVARCEEAKAAGLPLPEPDGLHAMLGSAAIPTKCFGGPWRALEGARHTL